MSRCFLNTSPDTDAKNLQCLPPSCSQRKLRLVSASLVTVFPVIVWMVGNLFLGRNFIEMHVWRYGQEPEVVHIVLLGASGCLELVAVFLLQGNVRKPPDWISILSVIDKGISIVLMLFFWVWITGYLLR